MFLPDSGPVPPRWRGYGAYPGTLTNDGPGRIDARIKLPARTRYEVWLEGSFGRPVNVLVDGRKVGAVSYELGNPGQYLRVGGVALSRGRHRITILVGGGSLHPGNAGADANLRHIGPLVFSSPANERRAVRYLAPARARALCHARVDWIELVVP
jgi:hypothetical protein